MIKLCRYIAGALVVLSVCCCVLAGCAATDRQMRLRSQLSMAEREAYEIKATLDRLEVLVERKRLEEALDIVSDRYRDQQGRDRDALMRYLQRMFSQYKYINISRGDYFQQFTDDSYREARVFERFSVVAEPYSPTLYTLRIDGYVEIYLSKENGGWKIVRWGQFYPARDKGGLPERVVIQPGR